MEEFQYTLNVTPETVKGLDSMVITCSSAIQVRYPFPPILPYSDNLTYRHLSHQFNVYKLAMQSFRRQLEHTLLPSRLSGTNFLPWTINLST